MYSVTKPCLTKECPHDRELPNCDAANDRFQAFSCPSSIDPHEILYSALIHWLNFDLPEEFTDRRGDVSLDSTNDELDHGLAKRTSERWQNYLDELDGE